MIVDRLVTDDELLPIWHRGARELFSAKPADALPSVPTGERRVVEPAPFYGDALFPAGSDRSTTAARARIPGPAFDGSILHERMDTPRTMERIVTPGEFRRQPWNNGAGVTEQIVRWPDSEDYAIRISIADLRDAAPFSRFPGYRRWSFLAGGAPITLCIGGIAHDLVALGDHIEVAGEVAIACARPPSPSRLLNVLVRDGTDAQIGRGPCPWPVRFVFALAAQPALPQGHAVVLDPPALRVLHRDAVWLCTSLTPDG
jgi:hypothetical protein